MEPYLDPPLATLLKKPSLHCKNVWVVSTHLWLSELQSSIDVSNSGKQKQVEITQTFLQCTALVTLMFAVFAVF